MRAAFAVAAIVAAAAAPVRAGPVAAASPRAVKVETQPVGKVFPFLGFYYRVDPVRRTRFQLAYRLHERGSDAPVRVTLLDGGESALPLDAEGWFERLPTLAELGPQARVRIESAAGSHLTLSVSPEALVRSAPEMAPPELAAAADQLNAALRTSGPLGFAIPKFTRVLFAGASGASGVDAAGRAAPLALQRGTPMVALAELGRLRALRFDKPPSKVLLIPG